MSFPAVFDVDRLDGKNGFILVASDCGLSYSLSGAGDINGDGISDLIASSWWTINGNLHASVYVVFGANSFPAIFDASSLNGANGFMLASLIDGFGSVSGTGDINGDGKSDLIIGAVNEPKPSKAFVIFGASSFPAIFDTSSLNGENGFTITSPNSWFGYSVAGTGDINGDGKPDLIIGAYLDQKAYVIFGANSFPAIFDTSNLNGKNGFALTSSSDEFGVSVSGTGDVNGDGKPDLIVGTREKAYVIFGAEKFPATFDTSSLNGANGFTLTSSSDLSFGRSVAGTADINGDRKPDLIIGAYLDQKAYVIFGASSFSAIFDTSSLNGANGFVLTSSDDNFGTLVSGTGDINDDGKPDLLIGADNARKGYVIFGTSSFPAIFDTSSLNGKNGFILASSTFNFGGSGAGMGDINNDGSPDLIIGSPRGGDKAYIIFGRLATQQNYGMLSQMAYFVPMNSTDKTGLINIGSTGEWCTYKSLFFGDFDGDGRSDLLCSFPHGQNYIMLSHMKGDGVTFIPMGSDPEGRVTIGINDHWCIKDTQELLIGDFNGDKKSDLLCHNNQQLNQGFTYVMLSTGNGFKPMADSPDGRVKVGVLGNFCPVGGRMVIGNFDGLGGDDLLCNYQTGENMIMISSNTSFVSINSNRLGLVTVGYKQNCQAWCQHTNTSLLSGHFNEDNKSDLICNEGGSNKIMIATFKNNSCDFQPIYPANSIPQDDGKIAMGQGHIPLWCDTSKSKLLVANIDGEPLDDLICNDKGSHLIQVCRSTGNGQYEFRSINTVDPTGDGRTKVGDYNIWCNSQNVSTGHFSDTGLDDLWCNQANSPVGEIYDEQA